MFKNNRPIFEIVDLLAYADDNYMGGENQNLTEAIQAVKAETEAVTKWMSSSGLKINELKTEICIFHQLTIINNAQCFLLR